MNNILLATIILSFIALFRLVGECSAATIEDKLNLPEKYRYERVLDKFPMDAGERRIIAELEGPGCIRHIYMTSNDRRAQFRVVEGSRNFILRIFWDGEESPSVEAPLPDLFGVHYNVSHYNINSYYLSVSDMGALACYFPMPFARSARLEVEAIKSAKFIYTLDWHKYLTDEFDEKLRFHASWRRENPAPAWADDFFVMDAVGRGYLIGFSLGVRLRSDEQRWSHAGSENFYIDGEATGEDGIVPHYLRAAGGENTFDTGFGGVNHIPNTHLYSGIPYLEYKDVGRALARHELSAYKFYVHDLLPFEKSLHFRWGSHSNDMCMTAYWYQTEPHRPFVKMVSPQDLQYGNPPWREEREIKRGKYDLLKQVGAEGPDTFLASPDDGTWSLYQGDKIMEEKANAIRPGLQHMATHGFVDFSHVFNVQSRISNVTWPANASAVTTLEVKKDTKAMLHLSWDDEMKIRLNDNKVQSLGIHQPYKYRVVEVKLKKGKNRLFVNLDNPEPGLTWGAWTFSCRVVLADGSVVIPVALSENN